MTTTAIWFSTDPGHTAAVCEDLGIRCEPLAGNYLRITSDVHPNRFAEPVGHIRLNGEELPDDPSQPPAWSARYTAELEPFMDRLNAAQQRLHRTSNHMRTK